MKKRSLFLVVKGFKSLLFEFPAACPKCNHAWTAQRIDAAGQREATCEPCRASAHLADVSYADPKAGRARPAVSNKKGYRIAS